MVKYLITFTFLSIFFSFLLLNREELPSRTPASKNMNSIASIIETVQSDGISSIEELLRHLDPVVFEKPILVYETKNKAQFASREYPRVIITMKNGTTLAFSTAPKEKGYNNLEVFDYDYRNKEFRTASIDFSKEDNIKIEKNSKQCLACHGDSNDRFRPKVDPYPTWAGWYGSRGLNTYSPEQEVKDFEKLKNNLDKNERLRYLKAITSYDIEKQHKSITHFQGKINHLVRKTMINDFTENSNSQKFLPALLIANQVKDKRIENWSSLSNSQLRISGEDLNFLNYFPDDLDKYQLHSEFEGFYQKYCNQVLSYLAYQEKEHNRLNQRYEKFPMFATDGIYSSFELASIRRSAQLSFILQKAGLNPIDYSTSVINKIPVYSSPDINSLHLSINQILESFLKSNPEHKKNFKVIKSESGETAGTIYSVTEKIDNAINEIYKDIYNRYPEQKALEKEIVPNLNYSEYFKRTNSQAEIDRNKTSPESLELQRSSLLSKRLEKSKPKKGLVRSCKDAINFLFGPTFK